MKKKIKRLFIANLIFYIFLFIHKLYVDDNVAQIFFYIALSLSSIVLEVAVREKEYKIIKSSIKDFLVRIAALVIHFIGITYSIGNIYINLITIFLLIINLFIEYIMYNKVRYEESIEGEEVTQEKINKFIEDYKGGKLDSLKFSIEVRHKISEVIKRTEIHGKHNIILIILFIMIFITRFIFDNIIQFVGIPLIVITILLYNQYKLLVIINIKRSYLILFIVGYIILLISETILLERVSYFIVSIRMFGILFLVPLFNTKFLNRMELARYIK